VKDKTMRETFKWKRKSSGHYILWGEYVVGEKEIMAEVKKESSKWKYCLWTWGTENPSPLDYSWQVYKTAKDVKNTVADLIINGEPQIK